MVIRNWTQSAGFILIFTLPLLMSTGCATPQPGIPQEEIRARADRAFDDLEAEENPSLSKTFPEKQDRKIVAPSTVVDSKSVKVTKGRRPDWINAESRHYPSAMYLTGVGYAPDRQSSEDKARAEIAKIFYSEIDSKSRTYQEYIHTISGRKSKTTDSIAIEDITEVSTQKLLSGVRIVQVYQQTQPETLFYALAVLDRDQSKTILQFKIKELDRDIQKLLTQAQRENDKLSKMRDLKACIGKYILRDAYNTELRIINPSGHGIPSQVSFAEMKKQLTAALLRDFFMAVFVKGSRSAEIRQALVEALNQKGFSVSDDIDRASVLARGTVQINPIEQSGSDWQFVRWKAYFDLVDQQGGAIFGSVKKTGKEGHLTLLQAEERAVRKIQRILAADIAEDMTNYIFSQGN
jgi:hypothetical protein